MAKVKMTLPDEYMERLAKLGSKTDEICGEVVTAGGEEMLKAVKTSLKQVVGKNLQGETLRSGKRRRTETRSTNELINALGLAKPLVDNDGNTNVKVGFAEPRRQQTQRKRVVGYTVRRRRDRAVGSPKFRNYYVASNAMIANILEHGKHGQPPKPFLTRGKRKGSRPCKEAMIQKFDLEVGKL